MDVGTTRIDRMEGDMRTRGSRAFAAVALALGMAFVAPAWADRIPTDDTEIIVSQDEVVSTAPTTTVTTTRTDGPWPGDLTEVSPYEDAFAAQRPPNKGVGFLESIGTIVLGAVVFPVKMVVGVAGAELGGVAGAMGGGDERAAAGVWNVTTDGSYFVTPEVMEGEKPFRLTGDHP